MTVVSSTGTLQALNEAPSIVSVITKEQIRQFGLFTLADALQQMPGTTVLINEFGDKIVAARGLSSSPNILVLLDGERLNDFYDGSTPYTYPLANIERIEMIRGPGSALYGTNALSAVISMFSKQPSRGTSLELTGEVLPENSVSLGGRAAFLSAFESSHYGILASGNFYGTQGPHVLIEKDYISSTGYSKTPGETKPTREEGTFHLQGHRKRLLQEGDQLLISGHVIFTRHHPFFGSDVVFSPKSLTSRTTFIGSLKYNASWTENLSSVSKFTLDRRQGNRFLQTRPEGAYSDSNKNGSIEESEVFPNGINRFSGYQSYHAAFLQSLNWKRPLGRGKPNDLTLGVELVRDWLPVYSYSQNYISNGQFSFPERREPPDNHDNFELAQRGKTRTVAALFVQDQFQPFYNLWLTGGLRYDSYSDFGYSFNPRAALIWKPKSDFSIKVLYGHAFRAPTFEELYDYSGSRYTKTILPIHGNAELKAETTNTFETGLEYNSAPLVFKLNPFLVLVGDSIEADPTSNVGGAKWINSPGRRVFGFDTEFQIYKNKSTFFGINASWLSASQLGSAIPGREGEAGAQILDRSMVEVPVLRLNLLGSLSPAPTYSVSATYNLVGPSENNRRFAYETVINWKRPMFHQTNLRLAKTFANELIDVSVNFSKSIGETIPIVLYTGWYQAPVGENRVYLTFAVRT